MEIKAIKEKMKTSDYAFLFSNKNLQNNIVLLGLGGSYAYGTNVKNSDIDIRGIATRAKQDILIGNDFEQVVDVNTDTTIYSLRKTFKLFCAGNPNVIEILGLKPEHYFYISDIGHQILKNKDIFLSQKTISSFCGYIQGYLKQLEKIKGEDLKKTSKTMMHIIRLYLMCIDILEKGEIVTYREKERPYLLNIRKGNSYIDNNGMPTKKFYKIVDEYEQKIKVLRENSLLPKNPDMERVNILLADINEKIVAAT